MHHLAQISSHEVIAHLTRAGYLVVACTNQACIGRSTIPLETVEDIHHPMVVEIPLAGGSVEKIYYCPRGKDEGCSCHKPRPGLLLRTRDELGIEADDAILIGDSITDVRAVLWPTSLLCWYSTAWAEISCANTLMKLMGLSTLL
jgi:histidinol-phosphate phosphatase family protein